MSLLYTPTSEMFTLLYIQGLKMSQPRPQATLESGASLYGPL